MDVTLSPSISVHATVPRQERPAPQPTFRASSNRFDMLARDVGSSSDDETQSPLSFESDGSMSETFIGLRRDLSQFDDPED